MTKDDYRATLERLGLNQAGAARLLGVADRTSRSWATGEKAIPPPASRFLRAMAALGIAPVQVHEAIGDVDAVKPEIQNTQARRLNRLRREGGPDPD